MTAQFSSRPAESSTSPVKAISEAFQLLTVEADDELVRAYVRQQYALAISPSLIAVVRDLAKQIASGHG